MTDKKIVLVTGVSRGIGRAIALHLAQTGTHVVGLSRTQGALEALDDEIAAAGGTCTLIPADLTDREMMARLPAALGERFGRLDGLVANAGSLGDLTPVADTQAKVWDSAIELNITANLRLLAGLDPLLRAAPAARIVGISSSRARKFVPFWSTYSVSKAGLEALFKTYAAEMADTPVRTNLVDPGPIATVMREKAMPGEDPDTLPQPSDLAPLVAELLADTETRNGEVVSFKEWAQ